MLKKIKSKKGISHVITLLIIVVITAAVAFYVCNNLGKAARDADGAAETQITNSIEKSKAFAEGQFDESK